MPIPPDTRAPGDAGHVADHNNIADELTALTAADVAETVRALAAEALLAPKASPALTGTPTAPTATALTGTTQVATTAYADSAVTVEANRATAAEALKAPLASPALTGTPTAPTQTAGDSSTRLATTAFVTAAAALKAGLLTPAAVKTASYTAAAGDFVPVDTTSGNVTITLPNAPADLTVVAIKHVIQGGTNTVTIACAGSDVFNKTGGATSGTLTLLAQGMLLQYKAAGGIWYVTADDLPLPQLDGRYPRLAAASTYTADQYFESGRPWYDVIAFGADPTGAADSTAAFNACIAAITGAAAPATNSRLAKGPMFIPAGVYKITSDLIIRSVQNFRILGAGCGMVQIKPSGTGFTTAVILIDGSLDGVFEGFTIQGDGTEQVTSAIRLDWTTAALRSTTGNVFSDIRIRSLKFVTGISLEGTATRQLDGTNLVNVAVFGGQTPGSWTTSGNWQKGIAFGNGTFANVYDQRLLGSDVGDCYYGAYCNASGFAWYGGQMLGNAVDFSVLPMGQVTIDNIQSQDSGQFIAGPAAFSPYPVGVSNVTFTTTKLDASGYVAKITGGMWKFSGFNAAATQRSGGYVAGAIQVAGDGANRPGIVVLENVALNNTFAAGIVPTASEAEIVVLNYSQYDNTTGLYTVTPFQYYNGTAWIAPGSTTAPDIQWYATVGTATWTKPAGAVTTEAFVMSGGAGGGSGRRGAAGTVRCGGGGGAGSTLVSRKFAAADLTSTVTVTVGDGGAGGLAVTADDTSGNNGSLGGSSSFGTYLAGPLVTGGNGGTAAAGTGGTGSLGGPGLAGAGGSASAAGGAGVGVTSGLVGASGGAGGGGITSADVAGAGAPGNYSYLGGNSSSTFGTAGAVDAASPASGTSSGVKGTPGGSPGSGAASKTTAAQAGASAYANSGAGGAGGGASLNGNASGAGGKGGSGFVLVVSFFQ